ncbi:hypothetical protein HRbin23_01316 [bacterium HR23]|nr:hypothetical protein HRbin23_01316 [bacterium HR23]
MRLKITLQAPGPFLLPWDYPDLLRGVVYAALARWDRPLADALHNHGLVVEGHHYKPFTFSWLHPRSAHAQGKGLVMESPVYWWVSSPLTRILEAVVGPLLLAGEVRLGEVALGVASVEVEGEPPLCPPVEVETLAPLVVSTVEEREKGRVKVYLSPWDERFQRVLTQSLVRKARALGQTPAEGARVRLTPLGGVRSRLTVVAGTQVRGFEGRFRAEGDPLLLGVGYSVGFGERNGQGFGMVRLRGG